MGMFLAIMMKMMMMKIMMMTMMMMMEMTQTKKAMLNGGERGGTKPKVDGDWDGFGDDVGNEDVINV